MRGTGRGEEIDTGLPRPGLYEGVPFETYRAWPAINASLLHSYARSPLHARYEQQHPRESAAFDLGHAVHAAILEPDVYRARFVPKWRATGTGSRDANRSRVAHIARHGLVELDDEERAQVEGMRDAVLGHPIAVELACALGREVSAVWIDPEHGVACKARFDLVLSRSEGTFIADLKTARSASPREFQGDAARYGYHVAAAHYLAGAAALHPGADRGWLWIVVETEPPHGVALYEPDQDFLAKGWAERQRLMELHLACTRAQEWPGYPADVQALAAPRWL